MLAFVTILIMGLLTYALLVEGLFGAFITLLNVCAAGLVAFNFWEPLADQLESGIDLSGYEDAVCLAGLFCLTLGLLRLGTTALCKSRVEFPEYVQQLGGALIGAATGYLVAGFLVCVFQTLPWHENFMMFDPTYDQTKTIRRLLPPDRVWLALMHRAGLFAFATGDEETFDDAGTFELRYGRYRRYVIRDPMPYDGGFEHEVHRSE